MKQITLNVSIKRENQEDRDRAATVQMWNVQLMLFSYYHSLIWKLENEFKVRIAWKLDGLDIPYFQVTLFRLEERRIWQNQKGILLTNNPGHLKIFKGLPTSLFQGVRYSKVCWQPLMWLILKSIQLNYDFVNCYVYNICLFLYIH